MCLHKKKTRFTASRFLCHSFRCMNRRAFLIQSAIFYAEKKLQHNCLCIKGCYNDARHKTGHVRLKLGNCFININYKKRLELREWGP